MTTDDKEIVSALRKALPGKVGQERFALWFGSPQALDIVDGALVVSAPDKFALERLRKRFCRDLQTTCAEVLGHELQVQFRLAVAGVSADETDQKVKLRQTQRAIENDSHQQPDERQFAADRFANLDAFVVGDANRVAHTAVRMALQRLGAVTPLFLYGPTGCGKTHLAEGMWTTARRAMRMQRVVMLSAEQFTSYFLEALHGRGLPNFRRRYRDLQLLILDDVQFFAGKRATLVELLHTIDTLLRDGRQVVLTADRPPVELTSFGPELITRMSGGVVCGIEPPDKATRLGIARSLCTQRGYSIPVPVLEWLASELSGDARQLSGAVNRLYATAQALERPITLELAGTALADIVRSVRPAVQIADVERAVCDVFGLEPKALRSSRKSPAVSQPRALAMWLARKYTRAAFSEIGHYFGRRSHSTVISAQKKVHAWMRSGKPMQLAQGPCHLEDAIRRVESRLRVG